MDPRLYYPIVEGRTHDYLVEEMDDTPQTIGSVTTVIENVKNWSPVRRATVRRIQQDCGGRRETSFTIERDENGLYEGTAREPLFPIPVADGMAASGPRDRANWTVVSTTKSTRVPAGEFTNGLLLRQYGSPDTGAVMERIYAPGIGLVREEFGDESRHWWRHLTAHNIPPDLFLIHCPDAYEALAAPLARELRAEGVLVDVAAYQLTAAAQLAPLIERGLKTAKGGVIVISPAWLALGIPCAELEILLSRVPLAVLHDVSLSQAAEYCRALGERRLGQSGRGPKPLVDEIAPLFRVTDL